MSPTNPPMLRPRLLEEPSRYGALAAVLFGVIGYIACLLISVLTLRTEHQCSSLLDTVCAEHCATTLHNAWSKLFGLPITVYGASLYLIVVVLGWRVSRRSPDTTLRMSLLVLAWLILVISVGYAGYAVLVLSAWCEYCALLYFTALGGWLSASLVHGMHPLRGLAVPRDLRGRMNIVLVTLGVCTSLALHVNFYRQAAYAPSPSCTPRDVLEPPAPFLTVNSTISAPPFVAAVFIDFSCPHCRSSVDFWRSYQASRRGTLELRFFHFPADCTFPSQQLACDAARAFTCLARTAPDQGHDLLDRLLSLQDGPTPYFSRDRLEQLAKELGVTDLSTCMQDPATDRLVDSHVLFAEAHDLQDRPAALLIRMNENTPINAIQLRGGVKDEAFLDREIARLYSRPAVH